MRRFSPAAALCAANASSSRAGVSADAAGESRRATADRKRSAAWLTYCGGVEGHGRWCSVCGVGPVTDSRRPFHPRATALISADVARLPRLPEISAPAALISGGARRAAAFPEISAARGEEGAPDVRALTALCAV